MSGTAPTRARARGWQQDLRDMAQVAAPIVLINVGIQAMGLVDTLMVGRLGGAAIAAVALGNFYFFNVSVFGIGLLFVGLGWLETGFTALRDSALAGYLSHLGGRDAFALLLTVIIGGAATVFVQSSSTMSMTSMSSR